MAMRVELTVRDQATGAILTVVDTCGIERRKVAVGRATWLAVAWAKMYGMPQVRQSGGFWTIGNEAGITQAQVSIREDAR